MLKRCCQGYARSSNSGFEVQVFVNTTEISQHSCWYQSVHEPFGYNDDAPHVSVGPEDLPKEVRMTDGANPPPAHNWHLERTNTAVKRSAHALVTATELRNYWSVHRDSFYKTTTRTPWVPSTCPYSTCNFCVFVFAWNQTMPFSACTVCLRWQFLKIG